MPTLINRQTINSNYPLTHSMSNSNEKLRFEQETIQPMNPILSYVVHDYEKSVLNLMSQELGNTMPTSSYPSNTIKLLPTSNSSLFSLNDNHTNLSKKTCSWSNYPINEGGYDESCVNYTLSNNNNTDSVIPSVLTTHSVLNNPPPQMTAVHNTLAWSTNQDVKHTRASFIPQNYPSTIDESSCDESLSDDNNNNTNPNNSNYQYYQSQILYPPQLNSFSPYIQASSAKLSTGLISHHNNIDYFSEKIDLTNLNSRIQYPIENDTIENQTNLTPLVKQTVNHNDFNNSNITTTTTTAQFNPEGNTTFSNCTHDQTFRQWLNDSLTVSQVNHCTDNCRIPVLLCPRSM
ncbi:unnamed protein product [Trichobilharzia szidati]|nr:unnamed protein product [Trichobilharzia szidati]